MLAAAVDDDLPRLVLDAVIALELVGDRLAKLRDAAARRVLGEAVGQRLRGSVLDVLRCVEVRLTGAKPMTSSPWARNSLALAEMASVSDGTSEAARLEIG